MAMTVSGERGEYKCPHCGPIAPSPIPESELKDCKERIAKLDAAAKGSVLARGRV